MKCYLIFATLILACNAKREKVEKADADTKNLCGPIFSRAENWSEIDKGIDKESDW